MCLALWMPFGVGVIQMKEGSKVQQSADEAELKWMRLLLKWPALLELPKPWRLPGQLLGWQLH